MHFLVVDVVVDFTFGIFTLVGGTALEGLAAVGTFDDVVGIGVVHVLGYLRFEPVGQLDLGSFTVEAAFIQGATVIQNYFLVYFKSIWKLVLFM